MKSFFFRLFFSSVFIWIIIRGGIYLLPGDPAEYLAHESMVPIQASVIRESLNLNHTFTERVFSLPETHSLINSIKSEDLLRPAITKTLTLSTLAFSFSFLITVALLYLYFAFPWATQAIHTYATGMASLPLSVMGPLAILTFCVQIPIFPITQSPWLPALCLALHLSAFWFRSIQKKIDRFLPQSSVLGARSRGLSEFKVFFKNLFIPVLGSIASFLGTEFGNLLSGSVLVEIIFQWNGIGSLLLKSVHQRDYPLIEVTLLITALATVLSQQLGYWFQRQLGAEQ